MNSDKKIIFTSDFHLGADAHLSSRQREKNIVRWLSSIQDDLGVLYLVGDIFDYWYEYRYSIPKGFSRLLGKLAELSDGGIEIHFFTGNHDMWMFHYLKDEMDIQIHHQPIIINHGNKKFFVGHGDGLGPGDHGYKFLKKILSNKLCQWGYARLHPNFGLRLMKYCSRKSRAVEKEEASFTGKDKEWLIAFSEDHVQENDIDYYVFGHRHILLEYHLKNGPATYFNLGDWLTFQSYLEYDGKTTKLHTFETNHSPLIIK